MKLSGNTILITASPHLPNSPARSPLLQPSETPGSASASACRSPVQQSSLPAGQPLHRLRLWFDIQVDFLKRAEFRNGCLIGNFSAEVGPHSDTINTKLIEIYEEIHESVVYCLKAAVKSGELPARTDCKELAHFLYSSLQGAILQAKVERSPLPLKRFIKIAYSTLLRQ